MKMDWRSMRIAVTLLTLGLSVLAMPASLEAQRLAGIAHVSWLGSLWPRATDPNEAG